MANLTGLALGILVGLSAFAPSTADAIYHGDNETVMRCSIGYVTVDGYTTGYKTCWTEVYYTPGVLTYGLDSAYEWNGYGNGGVNWSESAALEVPSWVGTLKVSPDGKKAWATNRSCSDEEFVRMPAAQAAATYAGLPMGFPAGHLITLFMPGGERQTFRKVSGGASSQYVPTTTCGKSPSPV